MRHILSIELFEFGISPQKSDTNLECPAYFAKSGEHSSNKGITQPVVPKDDSYIVNLGEEASIGTLYYERYS